MKIVAIVGSLRNASLNLQLAQRAKDLCQGRAEVELLRYQDVPMMNQDIEFPAPETVARVRQTVSQADGVWFFSPEYNHFFPGVLKNLIDWLSRPIGDGKPQVLGNRPAAVSGITPGMSGTGLAQDHLVTLLSFLNMRVMNSPRLTIPNAMQLLEGEKLVLDQSTEERLQKQADAFLQWIAACQKS